MARFTINKMLDDIDHDIEWVDAQLSRRQHPRMLSVKQQLVEKKRELQIKNILNVI